MGCKSSEHQPLQLEVAVEAAASLVAQMVMSLPAPWETQVRTLGREDTLEKEMATPSSILAWGIP